MTEPREPDRFDKQARELFRSLVMDEARAVSVIAAALRAERRDTLQASIDACDNAIGALQGDREVEAALECIKRIRALIPSAAVPELQRDIPCRGCGHPLWWHQWESKEHAFCCAPLDDLQRDYCQCKNYEKPAAAPAAEPRLDNLAAESPAPAAETWKWFWVRAEHPRGAAEEPIFHLSDGGAPMRCGDYVTGRVVRETPRRDRQCLRCRAAELSAAQTEGEGK